MKTTKGKMILSLLATVLVSVLLTTHEVSARQGSDVKPGPEPEQDLQIPKYHLIVKDIYRDFNCDVVLKLANNGWFKIPDEIYKDVKVFVEIPSPGGSTVTYTFSLKCYADISSANATYVLHTGVKVDTASEITASFNDVVPSTGRTELMGDGPCVFVLHRTKSKPISNDGAKAPSGVQTKKKSTLPTTRAVTE